MMDRGGLLSSWGAAPRKDSRRQPDGVLEALGRAGGCIEKPKG